MTSKFSIFLGIILLVFNIYMIKDGYDYTHLHERNEGDGQYGMVYSFYGMAQALNFIICVPLLIILINKHKNQRLMLFRIALGLAILNPIFISVGWAIID